MKTANSAAGSSTRPSHAVANGLIDKGVRAGDGVAILARNHRWFLIANYGAARVGARIILLNSEFSGPQIKEVSEREGAKVIIYDDEYTKAVNKAEPELGKLRALGTNPDSDEPSGSERRNPGRSDRAQQQSTRSQGEQARVDHHPDQWHDRHTEGGQPQHPTDAGAGRRHLVACPVQGERDHLAAGADVPRAGLPARHLGDVPRVDAGAAAQVQAADGARRHREAQGDRHGRGAGHAVTAPGCDREDGQETRPVQPEDHLRVRFASWVPSWPTAPSRTSARSSTTCTARPRSPSPPSPGQGSGKECGHGRSGGQGREGQDSRRQRQRAAAGRRRADLRRQRLPVRGLHRRWSQADHRRPDVVGRRRLLRRVRPALRRAAATTR